jgi:hypothetical protein
VTKQSVWKIIKSTTNFSLQILNLFTDLKKSDRRSKVNGGFFDHFGIIIIGVIIKGGGC